MRHGLYLPKGFGVRKLLTAAVAHTDTFSRWCDRLWEVIAKDGACQRECLELGVDLAYLSRVPKKTVLRDWTAEKCKSSFETMKYVFDLWSLNPSELPGPEPVN